MAADLDFDDPGSYASGAVNSAWTSGAGWYPIGDYSIPWNSTLSGSGHTISNLFINQGSHGAIGLFGVIGNRGSVRDLGLAAPSVASGINVTGALVGENKGRITAVYGADVDVQGRKAVGGLVGSNVGTVERSYVTGSVSGSSHNVGGVVGWNSRGTIRESYVTAAVHGGGSNVGGLTGRSDDGGTVRNSYSTGRVSGGKRVGGLIGLGAASHSYYDTQTSGRSSGLGPKTTAELQSPTSASGIYTNWNSDLWDFGTASDYPLLSVDFDGDGTASWQEFGQQTRTPPPPATVALFRLSTEPGVDGTYAIGDSIEIMVAFSENVAVTGAPQLTLDFGGTARTAAYHSAGGGTVVFFTYTVAEGDVASSGIAIPANALSLNGGSIMGLSGVAVDLAHEAVAPSKFRRVDGVRPTISSGSVSEDGRQVSVVFNEPVQTSPLLQSFIDKLELPPAFQFIISVLNVEVDGTWPKQTNAVVSGNTVTFTMDQAIASGQEVRVRYDGVYARHRAAIMMDKSGNHVANFGPTSITNNSTVTADAGASGVTISSRDIEIKEGQSASYNVRLQQEPAGPVTVAVTANNPDNVTISPMKLEFDGETWDTDQRVTITSDTDDNSFGHWMRVRHTATGSGYTGQDTIRVLMRE